MLKKVCNVASFLFLSSNIALSQEAGDMGKTVSRHMSCTNAASYLVEALKSRFAGAKASDWVEAILEMKTDDLWKEFYIREVTESFTSPLYQNDKESFRELENHTYSWCMKYNKLDPLFE